MARITELDDAVSEAYRRQAVELLATIRVSATVCADSADHAGFGNVCEALRLMAERARDLLEEITGERQ
jgi:hypothetical protein